MVRLETLTTLVELVSRETLVSLETADSSKTVVNLEMPVSLAGGRGQFG